MPFLSKPFIVPARIPPFSLVGPTKVQHLSFEYFTSRGVTLAGAKAANRV